MRERIKVVRSMKMSLLSRLESTTLKLKQQSELSYFEKELILQWAEYHGSITFQNTKKKQINKFHQLIHEKCQKQQPLAVQDHILDRDRLVINLTKTKLSEGQQRVLELGLNIASTPKEIPKMDIVARTEEVARRIKDENVAQTLRERIKIHLEEAKPPTKNLTPSERRAITSLKKNRDLVILPADKGRATVVMNQDMYKEKMMKLLDSKDYCIVKKNPIPRMELAIRTILSTFERAGMIDTHIKRRLTPYNSLIPQIYGLPKIHKEGCPMRPIVCTIDSPSYQLAKFITKILAPLTGHTDTFIGNSTQFVEESKQWELDPQDLMISFDVKSLFTSVPINVVMTILMERLEADSTLGDRTALDPYQICQLTEKCLGSTYFAFQGQIYQQIQDTAMGSPLSPVIANIFMEDFETTALVTADYQPKVWKRYVDDTFVIWPHGREKLNAFLQHINSLHPNISFTMEIEKDHKIAFLDVMIERENNRLKTTVYCKPTHTNLYLNFRSNHHPRIKFGIVQCLKHRAKKICSEETVETELELLSKVFVANGYK